MKSRHLLVASELSRSSYWGRGHRFCPY